MAGIAEALATVSPSLRGFTVWRTRRGWQASRQNADGSWRVATAADIGTALLAVLPAQEMLS